MQLKMFWFKKMIFISVLYVIIGYFIITYNNLKYLKYNKIT
jgi:hypothetical protein